MIRVLVPPVSTRLARVDDLAVELGVPVESPRLPRLLDAASAEVAGFIGRPLARMTVEETFRPEPGAWGHRPAIMLSRRPVVSVVSVVDHTATVDPSGYMVDESGILHLSAGWGWRTVVTYVAGYLLPGQDGRDLPADIERACIERAANAWHMAGRDRTIRSETTEGVGSISYATSGAVPDVPAEFASILRYRDVLL